MIAAAADCHGVGLIKQRGQIRFRKRVGMIDDVRTGGLQDRINGGIDKRVKHAAAHRLGRFQIELGCAGHPGTAGDHG